MWYLGLSSNKKLRERKKTQKEEEKDVIKWENRGRINMVCDVFVLQNYN